MYVVHLYVGEVGGGRFAITTCSQPKPFKRFVEVTQDRKKVTCKKCLIKLNPIYGKNLNQKDT